MTKQHYRLNVRYSGMSMPAQRRRTRNASTFATAPASPRSRRPQADAIRGILIAAPVAALLWAPIIWGFSHLI